MACGINTVFLTVARQPYSVLDSIIYSAVYDTWFSAANQGKNEGFYRLNMQGT